MGCEIVIVTGGGEGQRFLGVFSELKLAVGDDPATLAETWEGNERLPKLCDELYGLVRSFEVQEERSLHAFTHHVSAAGTHARRDYDDRWAKTVATVAGRDLLLLIKDLLGDDHDESSGSGERDRLGVDIAEWKHVADEEAKQIEMLADFAHSRQDDDSFGDFDWVHDSLQAWDRLRIAGLDLKGALWRRRAIPHVLVPGHVARHYGESRASLYRRLHQAARAFIFDAPLAALALQRAVLEEVMSKHWGAERGDPRNANFPLNSWGSRASRLKRLANEALHSDPEKLDSDQLDRAIIENFLLLRLVIESAPEMGAGA